MRKYVHRVGRTARAGREGDAWSLVEEQEVCGTCFYFLMVSSRYFSPVFGSGIWNMGSAVGYEIDAHFVGIFI